MTFWFGVSAVVCEFVFQNEDQVCVAAAVVRYTTLGKPRTGVTTTYLQDRLNGGDCCPVFMSRNPDFRLPRNHLVPVILIGPGTGIAPFMAFIQERGVYFFHENIESYIS